MWKLPTHAHDELPIISYLFISYFSSEYVPNSKDIAVEVFHKLVFHTDKFE